MKFTRVNRRAMKNNGKTTGQRCLANCLLTCSTMHGYHRST